MKKGILESDKVELKNSLISDTNQQKPLSLTPFQHLAARRDAYFAVDVFNVITYGVIAEIELFGDFAGGEALVE